MKYTWFKLHVGLVALLVPVLACGPSISQVTPTPTKTPIRERTVVSLPTITPSPTSTPTPIPTDTPTPVPPTDTPTPVPPTDTPTPVPPTNTPPPPPPLPPTNTPVPAQPTNPPPPPTPPPPPSSKPDVIVELPEGDVFGTGEEVKIIFIVRDPDGVDSFTWGIFLQNLTPLVGGDKSCGGATECRVEVEENAPPITGTYIVGADAVDVHGNTARGTSAIYVP